MRHTEVIAGWARNSQSVGWFGGVSAQLDAVTTHQTTIARLERELQAEKHARQQAISSRAVLVLQLNDALKRSKELEQSLADCRSSLGSSHRQRLHEERVQPSDQVKSSQVKLDLQPDGRGSNGRGHGSGRNGRGSCRVTRGNGEGGHGGSGGGAWAWSGQCQTARTLAELRAAAAEVVDRVMVLAARWDDNASGGMP